MSEFVNVPVGRQAQDMDISPKFQPYSGVEIIVSEDKAYFAGNRSGRVLQIENPWGTQTQATNILASLRQRGFQYQPYTANGALFNPAAELGDAVTVNGTYSGIYKMSRNYSPLMAADIEAPQDEEVDHEYPFEPKQDRVYQRAIAENKSQISLTQEQIQSEVIRATNSENQLRSSITQTATNINAEVSKKVTADTGTTSQNTFGWNLTSNSWLLYSGGKTVFKATKNGVEVTGKITASSGKIGGFTIGSDSITTNGQTWNGHKQGIYIGNSGIQLGSLDGSYFWASSSGNVIAKNMKLTGTLNIGGTDITAAALRSGAQTAYNRSGAWNGTTTTVNNNSGSWSTGANKAGQAYNVLFEGTATATYIKASHATLSDLTLDGHDASWKSITVITGVNPITTSTINYYGR